MAREPLTVRRLVAYDDAALHVHIQRRSERHFILLAPGHLRSGTHPKYVALLNALGANGYTTALYEPLNTLLPDGRAEARGLSTDARQLNAVYDSLVNDFGEGIVVGHSTGASVMHRCRSARALAGIFPVDLETQATNKLVQLGLSTGGARLNPFEESVVTGTYTSDGTAYGYPVHFWEDWFSWKRDLPSMIHTHESPKLYLVSDVDSVARPADVERNYLAHSGSLGTMRGISGIPHRFESEHAIELARDIAAWLSSRELFPR